MATERVPKRQILILGLLLVSLAAVVAYTLGGDKPAAPAAPASNRQRGRPAANGGEALPPEQALDVRIDLLTAAKPEPGAAERNPFRFRPKPPPPAPAPEAPPQEVTPPAPPPPPPGLAPPPPIPLKFIGVIESARAGKIASLRDERGNVHQGREGAVIEGRYRIVRIGAESIVMEYEDGRGRTTIRMTGQ